MPVTKQDVVDCLAKVPAPDGRPLPQSGALSEIIANDGKVFFSIGVDAAAVKSWEPVRQRAEAALKALPGVQSVMIALTAERAASSAAARPAAGGHGHAHGAPGAGPKPQPGVPGVGAIIAVASGKGGVGKSTTAVNLALGLRDLGLRVGVLDADIYGPSMPKLLGIHGKPETIDGKRLKPMEGYGLKVMSIASWSRKRR